ncbi:unnamed protein product [Mucor hiemalis]
MSCNNYNDDEHFARNVARRRESTIRIYKADCELKKKIQEGFIIDLCSDDEELPFKEELNSYENNNEMTSFLYALQLQQQEEDLKLAIDKTAVDKVDESILEEELPNIHSLFVFFNKTYFDNQLSMVEVKWSTKMTRCAGTCTYKGLGNCIVTLSEPLLKFRPKKDLFETLLHEMIHALLFITNNNTDRDGHGPEFLKEAKRISDAANLKITVYHTFHDEVDHYLTHVWQCNGICQNKPPYFGIVKRAVNRKPQKADTWFEEHTLTCGGTFTKIAEPPAKDNKKRKAANNTLDNYFKDVNDKMKKLKEF